MAEEKDTKKTQKIRRPQAQKRNIQSEKRRLRNKAFKSTVRTTIRHFEKTLEEGNSTDIQASLNSVYSLADKAVKRGIFKDNKAARIKSRLTARIKAPA